MVGYNITVCRFWRACIVGCGNDNTCSDYGICKTCKGDICVWTCTFMCRTFRVYVLCIGMERKTNNQIYCIFGKSD